MCLFLLAMQWEPSATEWAPAQLSFGCSDKTKHANHSIVVALYSCYHGSYDILAYISTVESKVCFVVALWDKVSLCSLWHQTHYIRSRNLWWSFCLCTISAVIAGGNHLCIFSDYSLSPQISICIKNQTSVVLLALFNYYMLKIYVPTNLLTKA